MIYGNLRALAGLKNNVQDAFNDWADKRDDATDPEEKRKARYVARHLEKALDKIERAMEIAR